MNDNFHILLLGGSHEAEQLAHALTARNMHCTVWLSQAPRGPALLPLVPILRRFANSCEMQNEMEAAVFNAVVDASHVFDGAVTEQGIAAAQTLGLPYLRVARPVWDVSEHSNWRSAQNVTAANAMIPKGARVFCATGWDSLADYAGFRGDVLMLRQTRRHDRPAPYPFVALEFGDPPFDAAQEEALFLQRDVDLLICRNLGGAASRPKLDAAAKLDLDVILIDRPARPTGVQTVSEVEAAMAWIDRL